MKWSLLLLGVVGAYLLLKRNATSTSNAIPGSSTIAANQHVFYMDYTDEEVLAAAKSAALLLFPGYTDFSLAAYGNERFLLGKASGVSEKTLASGKSNWDLMAALGAAKFA